MKTRTFHFDRKRLRMLLCGAVMVLRVHGLGAEGQPVQPNGFLSADAADSPIVTVMATDTPGSNRATVLTETMPATPKVPKQSDGHFGDEFTFVSARRGLPVTIRFDIRRPEDKHDFAVFDQNGRKLIDLPLPPSPDKAYAFTFHEEGLFDFKCLTHPARLIGQFIVLPSKSAKQ